MEAMKEFIPKPSEMTPLKLRERFATIRHPALGVDPRRR
jgi:hypothetical protein